MRAHSLWTVALMAACLGGATGCRHAIVQSDLPIKRVVVYRNGVAYFERGGHVEQDEVRFKMKQTEVGDFLATLAVMEQGGSSVRSAAFPLKMDNENEGAKPPKPKTEDEKRGLKTVVLSLDGREHDLQVGYVAESPVWRPSYRLVVQPDGQADLQAWGIVENLSGEDWSGVQLSLVAGAPLAFESRLGTPIIPERPVVTDMGEVIASMPKGETSLAQGGKDQDGDNAAEGEREEKNDEVAANAPPPPPAPAADASGAFGPGAGGGAGRGAATGASQEPPAHKAAPPKPSGGDGFVQPSGPRNLSGLAAIAVQGGSTRYDIPVSVNVPDKSATMVMLLSKRVRGEAIYLFAPDDGVADSASHPFRVARFQNGTAGVLERGPIAVFQQGSFLGQGLVDPLPAGAVATVPFALERAIGVDKDSKYDEQGARVAKIENGTLFLERDAVTKTTYHLKNGSDQPAKMLVKHPRASGTRLYQPPPDTEDNTGTGTALVPALVAARATGTLVVDERATFQRQEDWFSIAADEAVKAYMADPRANKDVVAKLQAAWAIRAQIVDKSDQRNKLQVELGQLAQEAQEKRADLRALEKNKTPAAEALKQSLTERLAAIAARQDVLNAQAIQVGQDLSELQIRWREAIRVIKLAEAPPPNP